MTWRAWITSVTTRKEWLTGLLAMLGIVLRSGHYGRNPAMWHDEAALVMNVIEKGFLQLLGPLKYAEAAPPLFLWLERGVMLTVGDGTYALRLIPYLAGCFTVALMWAAARRILDCEAVVWAVLLLSCSDRLLWHCCEAKPYAVDALLAMGIITLYVVSQSWSINRRILVYAVLAPIAVWISYPGCFLYGGLLLVLLPEVWRDRRRSVRALYALLALVVVLAFATMYLGPIRAQRHAAMDSCWVQGFPDWSRPWLLPWWFLVSTVEIVDYCLRPIGGVLAGVAVVGGVHLWRDGQRGLVTLIAAPILLAAVAAMMHAYPYTGARVMVYALPGIVILTAAGVRPVMAWLAAAGPGRGGGPAPAARVAQGLLLVLLLAPLGWSLYRTAIPWPRADTAAASAYVLAERQGDDPVMANHWEYDYYFRRLGSAYQPLDRPENLAIPDGRVWAVITAQMAQQRADILRGLLQNPWQVARQRDFARTTVVLLVRAHPATGDTGTRTGGDTVTR